MTEFIKALLLVVVDEMGDKTQLLAMAVAGKYKVKQVMIGVLIWTNYNCCYSYIKIKVQR